LQRRAAQAKCGIDEGDMGQGLRKIAEQSFLWNMIFLGPEPNIIGDVCDMLEDRTCLLMPALQRDAVRQPA
jgi:hypothetical protein